MLVSISAAFRQKVVFMGAMVAENHTTRGKMEDGHARANASMSTIPVAGERWICLGEFSVLLVQCGFWR